ncbi:unnamed protein product, partial [Iphiclides podalirius]
MCDLQINVPIHETGSKNPSHVVPQHNAPLIWQAARAAGRRPMPQAVRCSLGGPRQRTARGRVIHAAAFIMQSGLRPPHAKEHRTPHDLGSLLERAAADPRAGVSAIDYRNLNVHRR